MKALTWAEFRDDCGKLASYLAVAHSWSGIYGVPTGGCFVAMELAKVFDLPVLDEPDKRCLIVDDIIDSGRTLEKYQGHIRAAVYRKTTTPVLPKPVMTAVTLNEWVTFPWERDHPGRTGDGPEDAVVRLLEFIGEDPKREGLAETPGRVIRAYKEMTSGYAEDPKQILSKVFTEQYDEIVILQGCPFTSLCEHHLLSFTGTVDVGYLPGKVVGLSKLARLVECFSKRLQVQERMTKQIADALSEHLQAKGVAVVVRASHSCMACRGVKKPNTKMITSSMLGVFREKAEARAEFLSLCRE